MESTQQQPINISPELRNKLTLLFEASPSGVIVGGFLRSIVNKEEIRDIDFCVKESDYVSTINFCLKNLDSEILSVAEKISKLFSNKIGKEIDIIKSTTVADLLCEFDFTLCKGYLNKEYQFVMSDSDYSDMKNKRLVYCGSRFPLASYKRALELHDKGYCIDAYNLLKILTDCENKEGIKLVPDKKLLNLS